MSVALLISQNNKYKITQKEIKKNNFSVNFIGKYIEPKNALVLQQ